MKLSYYNFTSEYSNLLFPPFICIYACLILMFFFKREGDRSKFLGEYSSPKGQRGVFPILIKASHDGNLECVAKAQNNTSIEPTVSSHHRLRVIGESLH